MALVPAKGSQALLTQSFTFIVYSLRHLKLEAVRLGGVEIYRGRLKAFSTDCSKPFITEIPCSRKEIQFSLLHLHRSPSVCTLHYQYYARLRYQLKVASGAR